MKVQRASNAAALPDPFERFQLVSARVSGMEGSENYGTRCDLSLDAGALHLDIANSAAAYCQLAEGTPVLARGYVKAGRMAVPHPLNLQTTGTP